MTIHEPRRLSELEEVVGVIHSIEKTEHGLLVPIGKILVILPLEMSDALRDHEGKLTGILRLNGFHIREIEG